MLHILRRKALLADSSACPDSARPKRTFSRARKMPRLLAPSSQRCHCSNTPHHNILPYVVRATRSFLRTRVSLHESIATTAASLPPNSAESLALQMILRSSSSPAHSPQSPLAER